jgi:hypothetical protein
MTQTSTNGTISTSIVMDWAPKFAGINFDLFSTDLSSIKGIMAQMKQFKVYPISISSLINTTFANRINFRRNLWIEELKRAVKLKHVIARKN